MRSPSFDLIVVGAGLSGLVAAATAAKAGARVALVHGGLGSFVYGAGCVADLAATVDADAGQRRAVDFFLDFAAGAGAAYRGQVGDSHALPTLLGTVQPVALVPFGLWGGRLQPGIRAAIVGIAGLSSFDAGFIAERLNGTQGAAFRPALIDVPAEGAVQSALALANRFDRDPGFRHLFADKLRAVAGDCDQMLLPSCLGQWSSDDELAVFMDDVGCPLGEIPTLPPSVAGLRLSNRLLAQVRRVGVEVVGGHPVRALHHDQGCCRGVVVDNPGRPRPLTARAVVLASGPSSRYLLPGWNGMVDKALRPLVDDEHVLAQGLHIAGALLYPVAGHGGNGRAIVSGHAAGLAALDAEVSHATH